MTQKGSVAVLAVGVVAITVALIVARLGSPRPTIPSPSKGPPVPTPTDFAWFQLAETSLDSGQGIPSTGFILTLGRGGLATASTFTETYRLPLGEPLNLASSPSIVGSTDETAVIASFDGESSWLRQVDVATGRVGASTRFDGVIAAAIGDWPAGVAYVARLDPDTLESDGIWRVDAHGAAEQLIDPDPEFDVQVREGERVWLDLTPDGATLLRWVCSGDGCRLDGIDLASGQRRFTTSGLGYGRLIGTGNRKAVTSAMPPDVESACVGDAQGSSQPSCPYTVIDLQTGRTSLGERYCDDDIVVAQRDPLVLVTAATHPACGGERYRLIAYEIDRGRPIPVNLATNDLQLVPEDRDRGTTLDGAFVVAMNGEFPFGREFGTAEVVAVPR